MSYVLTYWMLIGWLFDDFFMISVFIWVIWSVSVKICKVNDSLNCAFTRLFCLEIPVVRPARPANVISDLLDSSAKRPPRIIISMSAVRIIRTREHAENFENTKWEGDKSNSCLLWILQWFCLFSLFQVRIDNSIHVGDKTRNMANGYVIWASVTVRYCVTAGSATSRRKTLRTEWGKALGRSKPATESG